MTGQNLIVDGGMTSW